jgi:hypothetical protein
MLTARGLIISLGMRDGDIRRVLRDRLAAAYAHDENTLLVEELGLCRGTVRVDLAIVNGILKGYEIKSERDNLTRLENQASIYSQVFDTVTLVVAERHLMAAKAIVPSWWGIEVASCDDTPSVKLSTVREEAINPTVDVHSLVQLLWREEVLAILEQSSPSQSFSNKPRKLLWEYLANSVQLDELKDAVRDSIRSRTGWRVDGRQNPSGEMCPLFSTSSDFRVLRAGTRNRRYTHRPN